MEKQDRRLGTGEIATYRKVIWKWFMLEEVLDYRLYEIEAKLNQKMEEMAKLYEQHQEAMNRKKKAEARINSSKTERDPYRSDTYEAPATKDAGKYRRARSKPSDMWLYVRNAILGAVGAAPRAAPSGDANTEVLGAKSQPIGQPIRQNNGKGKGNQPNQQQQR